MIKVEKDFEDIPNILTLNPTRGTSREIPFNANILAGNYSDDKNRYKVASIQKKLNLIYHTKCAYCEKKLLDTPKHIEHYRPKNGGYYWLAYSWDNLLLSCGECNSAKGDKFETYNPKITYRKESFEDIQNLSEEYDRLERPKLINPEKEDILHLLSFEDKGIISSEDTRVTHTIGACNLDRKPLNRLREEILVDFREEMEGHYLYYISKKDASRFVPTVEQFIKNCRIDNKFYAFRYFILNHLEIFFENKNLQNIIIKIIKKQRVNI